MSGRKLYEDFLSEIYLNLEIVISIHNRKTDECVPDFSCCEESINTPKSVKKAFIEAFNLNDDSHIQFLYSFLGDMIKREGKNAHIVTDGLIE